MHAGKRYLLFLMSGEVGVGVKIVHDFIAGLCVIAESGKREKMTHAV